MTTPIELAQSLNPENLVELFAVDLTANGFGMAYFTPNANTDGSFVYWGGNEYIPWPVKAEGFEKTSEGASPRPTLQFSSVQDTMTALIIESDGMLGATVRRSLTFRRFLDDGIEPDGARTLLNDIFRVERMSEFVPGESVTFELASPLDMEDAQFPKKQFMRSYCYWRYRVWDATKQEYVYSKISPCPYTGIGSWDKHNLPTIPALDTCAKTLTACKMRFSASDAVLPYGGFPGIAQKAAR